MRNAIGRSALGLGVAGILLLAASESRAGQTLCTTTAAGWNVPAGDPVFVEGPGPIHDVLAAVGEYRSHSMLSNGPDGWVTHATSVMPPQEGSWPTLCGAPIQQSFLYNSMPGLETVGQGAIYAFLYSGGTANATNGVLSGSEDFIAYQRANTSTSQSAVNNISFGGPGMAWSGWWSGADSNQYVWGRSYNGSQVHYGWYQYMNVQQVPQGIPGLDTGVVCSSSLALWQHDAGGIGDVYARTYNNSQNSNSNHLWNAANALYNSVHNECENSMGFWTHAGTCLICADCDLCDEAADQMVNCFTGNNCGSSSHGYWTGIAGGAANAVGISPDDVGCWNGNGTGAPCSGTGSSIWGWDGSQTVQWNSGGSQYSCWD